MTVKSQATRRGGRGQHALGAQSLGGEEACLFSCCVWPASWAASQKTGTNAWCRRLRSPAHGQTGASSRWVSWARNGMRKRCRGAVRTLSASQSKMGEAGCSVNQAPASTPLSGLRRHGVKRACVAQVLTRSSGSGPDRLGATLRRRGWCLETWHKQPPHLARECRRKSHRRSCVGFCAAAGGQEGRWSVDDGVPDAQAPCLDRHLCEDPSVVGDWHTEDASKATCEGSLHSLCTEEEAVGKRACQQSKPCRRKTRVQCPGIGWTLGLKMILQYPKSSTACNTQCARKRWDVFSDHSEGLLVTHLHIVLRLKTLLTSLGCVTAEILMRSRWTSYRRTHSSCPPFHFLYCTADSQFRCACLHSMFNVISSRGEETNTAWLTASRARR